MDDKQLAEIEARLSGATDPEWMIREYRKDIAALLAEVRGLREKRAELDRMGAGAVRSRGGDGSSAAYAIGWLEGRLDEAREDVRTIRDQLARVTAERTRDALDRQTAHDAWNDMRRQRDAALALAEQAKAALAEVMPSDSVWLDVRHALTVFEPEDEVSKWSQRIDAARKAVG